MNGSPLVLNLEILWTKVGVMVHAQRSTLKIYTNLVWLDIFIHHNWPISSIVLI